MSNDRQQYAMPPFVGSTDSSSTAILLAHYRAFRARQASVMMTGVSTTGFVGDVVSIPAGQVDVTAPPATLIAQRPELFVGVGLVVVGERTDEGHLITAVGPAYRTLFDRVQFEPAAFLQLSPRETEEVVAGG